MTLASKMARSADLMTGIIDRMGKTALGPDDVPSLAHGRRLRNMVLRCTTCPDPQGCAALQATVTHLDAPPVYCPNADLLRALPNA